MIAEKPTWIRHEGMQIFSIDVQPGGLRLATGGGDHKVCFLFTLPFVFFSFLLWLLGWLQNAGRRVESIIKNFSIYVM